MLIHELHFIFNFRISWTRIWHGDTRRHTGCLRCLRAEDAAARHGWNGLEGHSGEEAKAPRRLGNDGKCWKSEVIRFTSVEDSIKHVCRDQAVASLGRTLSMPAECVDSRLMGTWVPSMFHLCSIYVIGPSFTIATIILYHIHTMSHTMSPYSYPDGPYSFTWQGRFDPRLLFNFLDASHVSGQADQQGPSSDIWHIFRTNQNKSDVIVVFHFLYIFKPPRSTSFTCQEVTTKWSVSEPR